LEKTGQRDKEKLPMRNRVQSADGKMRRMVNKIHRWSRKLKSISGPVGQIYKPRVLADGEKEGGNQRGTPEGKHGGGGSI
jgi:hypothetical protein